MSDSNKLGELTHTLSDDVGERIAQYAYTYTSDAKIGTYNSTYFDLTTTIEFKREQSFEYDGRNQLLEVDTTDKDGNDQIIGQLVRTYEYDQNGNRITKGPPVDQDPLYENTVDRNRLLEDEFYTYTYDAEGNLTERIHKSTGDKDVYVWDFRNRLTSVQIWRNSIHETTINYAYDGLDRLIGREEVDVPSSQTYSAVMYLPDGMDRAFELAFVMDAATTTAEGAIIQSYLHGPAPGEVLANDVSIDGEFTATYWTFADPSGTLRSYVDWDDDLEVFGHFHNHFDEFGNLQDSGSIFPSGPFLPPIFDGRLEDPIASLYLDSTGGNAYHPETGRLLTATAGDAYAYQHNNPIYPEKVREQAIAQVDWDELEGPDAYSNAFNRFVGEFGHLTLDLAGAVPVIGAIPDALNAAWYAAVAGVGEAVVWRPFLFEFDLPGPGG